MSSRNLVVVVFLLFLLSACGSEKSEQIAETQDEGRNSTMVVSKADADVIFVRAIKNENDTWTFHVTISHPDTGWEDYADGWDVVLPNGTVLRPDPDIPYTRLLVHPHQNEQPFTRSQSGISIPQDVTHVTVRAHDLVDGFGGREILIDLSIPSGDGYTVEN